MPHTFEYDDAGRVVTARITDSPVLEFTYDDAGRLTREYQGDTNGNPLTRTYEYDADGRRSVMHEGFSDPNQTSWSCIETQNDAGGVDYEMTRESGDSASYPLRTEAYDAQGRHIASIAEGETRYYYHDEKGLVLMEIAAGDGVEPGSPDAGLLLVLLDAVNNEYHILYLGVHADAVRTYDDDGFLTRLDASDGSYAEFIYRSSDDAAVQTPEPSAEPEPTPEPVDTSWKQAYADYLTNLRAESSDVFENYYSFALIYLNDDAIPELVVDSGSHAGGGVLCTYSNGQVVSQHIMGAWGSDYLERENRFLSVYGISGVVMHEIFEIRDGMIVSVASGTSWPDPNDPNRPDEHLFVWNDVDVTQAEYDALLNQTFDADRAKRTDFEGAPKGSEVFAYIEQF